MRKALWQLYEREPGGEWRPRKVYAGKGDWLARHYDERYPDKEHCVHLVLREMGEPSDVRFVRYDRSHWG